MTDQPDTSATKKPRPNRATGRTVAFGTRLTQETVNEINALIERDGLRTATWIEAALEAYKQVYPNGPAPDTSAD